MSYMPQAAPGAALSPDAAAALVPDFDSAFEMLPGRAFILSDAGTVLAANAAARADMVPLARAIDAVGPDVGQVFCDAAAPGVMGARRVVLDMAKGGRRIAFRVAALHGAALGRQFLLVEDTLLAQDALVSTPAD
ncbi:MAG: hypothetical protein AAF914_14115 [Pseudomonadota bacterium]